jgi:septal ring-binding cell division protein DamX
VAPIQPPATAASTAVAAAPAAQQVVQAAPKPNGDAGKTSESGTGPVPPASGKLTRERFAATQVWLPEAKGELQSIQILTVGARDIKRIEDVLVRAPGRRLKIEDFYIYSVKINDQQHYRLAYGLYPGVEEAGKAMRELPAVYRSFTPFYRSIERMRSQNRQ